MIPTEEDLKRLVELDRGRYHYRSRSGHKYLIEVSANRISCGCPDFQNRRNGKTRWCKHITGDDDKGEIGVATLLGWRVLRQLQQQEKDYIPLAGPAAVDVRVPEEVTEADVPF